MTGERQTLHARLRAETRHLHDDLEAAVDIGREIASRASYANYLKRLWVLHTAAEDALAKIDFTHAGFDYSKRLRSRFLADDLQQLGFAPVNLKQLPRVPAPVLTSIEDGLGCVYVLEGSSLGARAILPQIKSNLGLTANRGASFFEGFGEEGKPLWRACLSAINDIEPTSDRAQRVVQSAIATFSMYLRRLPLRPSTKTPSTLAQA